MGRGCVLVWCLTVSYTCSAIHMCLILDVSWNSTVIIHSHSHIFLVWIVIMLSSIGLAKSTVFIWACQSLRSQDAKCLFGWLSMFAMNLDSRPGVCVCVCVCLCVCGCVCVCVLTCGTSPRFFHWSIPHYVLGEEFLHHHLGVCAKGMLVRSWNVANQNPILY